MPTGVGADDVFVAVDKFRNAAGKLGPKASIEDVAAVALPDAANAMLLTSITTAGAFFATAVCPVAPIRCFSIFLGLLVTTDYLLNVALVFPALCLHLRWARGAAESRNACALCCVDAMCCCPCGSRDQHTDDGRNEPVESLAVRAFNLFYEGMHKIRYITLALCLGALAWSAVAASSIPSPTSSEVQLLADDHEFTKWAKWQRQLLSRELQDGEGSYVAVVWGLKAADTGDYNDPNSFTKMVLDDTFDPSSRDAQLYMRDVVHRLANEPFAMPTSTKGTNRGPFADFERWLNDTETTQCGGATKLPVPPEMFHQCMLAFAREDYREDVLGYDGRVRIVLDYVRSEARFDSSFTVLRNAWNAFEDWIAKERETNAPIGVRAFFHTSGDFHWYDTNRSMLETAIQAGGIALAISACVVLISSRSITATLFAVLSIAYVLCAVTAVVVAMGWELGFLEAICFAILIGLSCDFVLHITHAYCHRLGDVPREERTRGALVQMGPSILSGAATTFTAGIVMFFCTISFFQKFGTILMLTMLHAMLGTFVVFISLADSLGPSRPTFLYDAALSLALGQANAPAHAPASCISVCVRSKSAGSVSRV